MFNCKRRQMCVRNQIGHSLTIREHLLEESPMLFSGSNNPCTRLFQPALNAGKRLFKGKWILEDPGICPDSNKGR
jgi:hypothetical protein